MLQNLPKRSLRDNLSYVILTISCLRARTMETSSLPTDSSSPCSIKQTEIFFILTVYQSASSGFRLLGEIPEGATSKAKISFFFNENVRALKDALEHLNAGESTLRRFLKGILSKNSKFLKAREIIRLWTKRA